MKALKYFREITITLLVIGVILLFFARSCEVKKSNERYAALQTEAKRLQEKVKQDSINHAADHLRDSLQMMEARKETLAAQADVKAVDKKLTAAQARASQLAAIISNSSNNSNSWVDTTCKELAAQIPVLNERINQYRKESDEAQELMNYEVILRDSVIERERDYSAGLKAAFNAQATTLKNALEVAKPRGRLLGGVGVIGNELNPLSGTKINLAYQSKGGKQYQAGAMIIRGGVFYEAGVLITLIK